MKKLISIFLLVAMLISVIPCVALSAAEEGETTAITPDTTWWDNKTEGQTEFEISTAEQLLGLAKIVADKTTNDDFIGKTIKITSNIDLNPDWDASNFTEAPANQWPEMTSGVTFRGTIDGQGHTIRGIYQKSSNAKTGGLFGSVKGSKISGKAAGVTVIKNLAIVNSYSECAQLYGHGMLFAEIGACTAGTDNVDISNVYIDARLVNTSSAGGDWGIGGFIGGVSHTENQTTYTQVNITNCVFAGSIELKKPTGKVYVGGFIGRTNDIGKRTLTDCAFYGTVSGDLNATTMIGGLQGYISSAPDAKNYHTYTNCISAGTYNVTGGAHIGAVCGASKKNESTPYKVDVNNVLYTDSKLPLVGGIFDHNSTTTAADATVIYGTAVSTCVSATDLVGIAAQETIDDISYTYTVYKDANGETSVENTKMLGWTATTMGKVLPRALVVNVPGVVETTVEGAATVLHGYQAKDKDNDKFDFRLVATVDVPENVTVDEVGFVITANYGTTTLTKDYRTNTVYNSVTGNTDTGLVAYTAKGEGEYALGGDYIFALAITGAPVLAEGAITLEVTTYYVSGEDTVYGETEVFTVTAPQDALN